jgi:hypothetical protein
MGPMGVLPSRPMALSNWDCLAYTLDGIGGSAATNHSGHTLAIYKNSLLMQHDGKYVAHITHGEIHVGDWEIRAWRGPQDGVYVVARAARYDTDGEHHDKALLVGCGVYGYTDPTERYREVAEAKGIDPDALMVSAEVDGTRTVVGFVDHQMVLVAENPPPSEWVGVQPSSLGYLRTVVDEATDALADTWAADALDAVPWRSLTRSNQGDQYFKDQDVALGDVATRPGEARRPLLEQVLRGQ